MMTTIYKEKTRCGSCGSESEYTGIGSTSTFGSADLDTRPPEFKRSTIVFLVQRCPECGFCASDVSKFSLDSKAVINSADYKNQLNDPMHPELANSFLCKAIIDRNAGNYAAATWALIYAAWACDDFGNPSEAAACRKKAADMIAPAEKHGQQISDQDGAVTAILVDLLRRSGQLEQAGKVIEARRAGIEQDIIVRILDFQTALIEKGDVSCYSIAEALNEE